MKILIITYSREVNPGTFLQAYGVQYVLRQMFPEARIDLLKHKRLYGLSGQQKGRPTPKVKKDWCWLKGRLLAIPRRIKYEWNYARKFHFPKFEFDFFDYDQNEFRKFAENYDLIVVGSDTILIDLKRNNHFGLMWLLNVRANKALFAASAAPANYEISRDEADLLKQSFSTFKLLSVRDSVTYNLLAEKIGVARDVQKIFDPTYLIPSSEFHFPYWMGRKLQNVAKKHKIALVNFGNAFEKKKCITEYLKKCGYFAIATHYNQWADMNIMTLSPFEWAALYQYVDLTVTERFHDCVFSLRNNKPVVAIDWAPSRFASDGSSKLTDLLNEYDLMDLHYNDRRNDDIKVLFNIIENVNDVFDFDLCKSMNEKISESYSRLKDELFRNID